jgi:hypothetical protein
VPSTAGVEVANPILKAESVRSIFTPALTEQGSNSLSDFIMTKGSQWSTALALATTDWPQQRKKGTAWCTQTSSYHPHLILLIYITGGGWAGTRHLMDPATGIAAVFGSQIVPRSRFDAEIVELWGRLEGLVYAGLQHGSEDLSNL